jgi:hypothetical protein
LIRAITPANPRIYWPGTDGQRFETERQTRALTEIYLGSINKKTHSAQAVAGPSFMKPKQYRPYLTDGLIHILVVLALLYLINQLIAHY